jgi:hypothetical protein
MFSNKSITQTNNLMSNTQLEEYIQDFPYWEILPHSADGNFPMMENENKDEKEQNVYFHKSSPGYMVPMNGVVDSLRDEPLLQDASLGEFFKRPIKIFTAQWNVESGIFQTFDPWSLFFENPRVINRLSNYKLMRSDLHLRFTINGNGFYYGRAIASYLPLHVDDKLTKYRAAMQQDVIGMSMRPHVFLNPTESEGGDMVLPFFYYNNLLDITKDEWRQLGNITMRNVGYLGLRHANGSTTPISVSVFAWAENIKFAIPTNFEPGSILPQAKDEYTGPVSKIASAVAKYAGYLTKVPTIGPFAKATQLGADAVGAIAVLFGYSRPTDIESTMIVPKTKGSLAVSNMRDDNFKLTVDSKQELSIDPRIAGLPPNDELNVRYIATRESYFTTFTWNMTGTYSTPEELLWHCVVDPGLYQMEDGNIPFLHMTSCCYACIPFKYWRGTMKFRFQIIASNFHKGRLKIVYDPTGVPSTTSEYNTAYTQIVDISDTKDVVMECGWGQNTTYRKHIRLVDYLGETYSTLVPQDFGNGTIAVYIVNSLTSASLATGPIMVNVYVSACDDFEVAEPDSYDLDRIRYGDILPQSEEEKPKTSFNWIKSFLRVLKAIIDEFIECLSRRNSVQVLQDWPMETYDNFKEGQTEGLLESDESYYWEECRPQSAEEQAPSAPTNSEALNTLGNSVDANDASNLVHFGEHIASFRQLLKRYTLTEAFSFSSSSGTPLVMRATRPHKPLIGGRKDAATVATAPVYELTPTLKYVYSRNHFINYTATAFAGWRGSVRYFLDTTGFFSTPGSVNVSRHDSAFPSNGTNNFGNLTLPAGLAGYNEYMKILDGFNGSAVQASMVNPTISFEMPHYSHARFIPAREGDDLETTTKVAPTSLQKSFTIFMESKGVSSSTNIPLKLYAAAGEDFTCFLYMGPPRVHIEDTVPS